MKNVLVTGANGFVGRSLIRLLHKEGFHVRAAARKPSLESLQDDFPVTDRVTLDLDGRENNYEQLLEGMDAVVHLAARVHRGDEDANDLGIYRKTNVDGTRLLAEQAARQGVKRFVFLSSIKVNGDSTTYERDDNYRKFREEDPVAPRGSYAVSKLESEHALQAVCRKSGMESVILRPPLVYGPGVKANFLQLLKAVEKGYPLPFASVNNLRSLLYVENLSSGILACLRHSKAANQLFLISDVDTSVPGLIQAIASALGRRALLLPCPVSMLKITGILTGRYAAIERLTQSLVIDSSRIKRMLQWTPACTLKEGMAATAEWYRKRP